MKLRAAPIEPISRFSERTHVSRCVTSMIWTWCNPEIDGGEKPAHLFKLVRNLGEGPLNIPHVQAGILVCKLPLNLYRR